MTKSERSRQIFKKGDIVSPFSDVKSSNNYKISTIIRAEVTKVEKGWSSGSYKQEVHIRVLKGRVIGTTKTRLIVFSNAIELNLNTENYDIY